MKPKVKLAATFAGVMLLSFVPELVPDFFGDWTCTGSVMYVGKNGYYHFKGCNHLSGFNGEHSPMVHYGFRHFIWILAGVTFFVWNIVSVIENKEE